MEHIGELLPAGLDEIEEEYEPFQNPVETDLYNEYIEEMSDMDQISGGEDSNSDDDFYHEEVNEVIPEENDENNSSEEAPIPLAQPSPPTTTKHETMI